MPTFVLFKFLVHSNLKPKPTPLPPPLALHRMADISNMYDVALKPKLLRSLLRDYVPDDKHPFRSPSELSYVVSTVKTHKLLFESAPLEQDLLDGWKAAVDSWVHRLLTLASSNLPDKCWAGISLLGVTCQECSSERFLASYSLWLNKLLLHIQPPAVSHFVRVAACAALSDLFTRLSRFPTARKDGNSQATKIIEPALKLLNADSCSVIWEKAICLLCTMMNFFPVSIHQYYDSVEAAIVSKIMSGKCNASVLMKLSYGLSLLPKSRGDEDSWSLMMEKVLLSINNQLNDAFQGLEEDSRGNDVMRMLLPSGKESPPPLGGLAVHEQNSDLTTWRPERLMGSKICALLCCCCIMLTSSYPVQVSVPMRSLLALAERVLIVDGSLSQSSFGFMTTLKQEFICSELPLLQLHSLEILTAAIKGLNSLVLPHVATIVRLLTEYLRTCAFPKLRVRAYSIVKVLLMSMGVGIAIHFSQDVINNIFVDLDFLGCKKDGTTPGMCTKGAEVLTEPRKKRRKHSSMTGSFQEQPAKNGLEVEIPQNLTPISVKIAALETLEALLTVGGSLKSESWRTNVDHLIITVAANTCRGGWSKEERNASLSGEPSIIWADFQLAALRALLASLLSPGRTRPSHLALGLELFRAGIQERGTKLAEYCGHALLTLEVLIHPRSLPLLDTHSSFSGDYKGLSHKFPDTIYTSRQRQTSTFQNRTLGKDTCEPESEDDDLNDNWLANDNVEMEIQVTDMQENAEKPPATIRNSSPEMLLSVKGTSVTNVPAESDLGASASDLTDKIMVDVDDFAVESPTFRNTNSQTQVSRPSTSVDGAVCTESGIVASEIAEAEKFGTKTALMENVISAKSDGGDGISTLHETKAFASEEHVSETQKDAFTSIVERISATLSNSVKGKGLMYESENELSTDSIPDIVDGDPDSD